MNALSAERSLGRQGLLWVLARLLQGTVVDHIVKIQPRQRAVLHIEFLKKLRILSVKAAKCILELRQGDSSDSVCRIFGLGKRSDLVPITGPKRCGCGHALSLRLPQARI